MKRYIIPVIAGLLIGMIAFWQTPQVTAYLEQSNVPNHFKKVLDDKSGESRPAKPLSMNEAYDMVTRYAHQWSSDSELLELFSSDARDNDVSKLMGRIQKLDMTRINLSKIQNIKDLRSVKMGKGKHGLACFSLIVKTGIFL